jgi:PAS domain S-box-containing protein
LESGAPHNFDEMDFEELAQEVSIYYRELQYQNEELRRIQEELQKSNARFTALFEDAPLGYVLCDEDFIVQNANKTFQGIIGAEKKINGKKFTDFVAPDAQDTIYFFLSNLKKKGVPISVEAEIVSTHANKNSIPVNIDGNIYHENNSRFFRLAVADISNRVKAEQALRDSEETYNNLFHNAQVGLFRSGIDDGRILESNDQLAKMFGYKNRDELINHFVASEYYIPKSRRVDMVKEIKEKGEIRNFKTKFRRKDGSEFVALYSARYYPEKGWLEGVLEDITQQEKSKVLLQEREELYRSLFENSTDAIYLMFNRRFEMVNPEFQRIFGYSQEELVTQKIDPIQLIAPESLPVIEERIRKLESAKEVSTRYEFTAVVRNGEKREMEASVTYIPYKGGTATQGILRDVTERKKAEEKIKSLSEFRNLLVDLSANFIHVPVDKINDSINRSLARLGEFVNADRTYIFEYNFDENFCSNTFEWCRDGIVPQIDKLQYLPLSFAPGWVKKHRSGQIVNIPNVEEVKDGTLRNLLEDQDIKSVLSIPLFNQEECIGFIGFDSVGKLFNFSSAEIEVLQIYATILVNSFERQHREEELIIAKERAEESDLLKSAFLANMSHEIRTPMNGIMGFTSLLKNSEVSGKERESFIEIIQQSGKRMLDTVNDLIDISRIETGQVEVEREEFNLKEELKNLFVFFEAEAKSKNLEFKMSTSCYRYEIVVNSDRNKFNSVVSNLIKNAIKYTEKGSIEIGCQSKNNTIEFYIKDTGIGIPEKLLKDIFNRFVQVEQGYTRNYEGAGLGLSIAKAYAKMLGGDVWVKSEEGKGSVFYFSLPLPQQKSEIQAQETNVEEHKPKTKILKGFKNLEVLVAEDDEVSRFHMKLLLESKAKKIHYAQTGDEAVNVYQNNREINLILMDIKMPVMDGHEATKKIRTFDTKVPIIAQTAYALQGDQEKALDAGCDDYVTKPVNADELIAKIGKLLQKQNN